MVKHIAIPIGRTCTMPCYGHHWRDARIGAGKLFNPGAAQLLDVRGVDLLERRETAVVPVPADRGPVLAGRLGQIIGGISCRQAECE